MDKLDIVQGPPLRPLALGGSSVVPTSPTRTHDSLRLIPYLGRSRFSDSHLNPGPSDSGYVFSRVTLVKYTPRSSVTSSPTDKGLVDDTWSVNED